VPMIRLGGFKSDAQVQRFSAVHGLVQNLFRVGRHLLRSAHHRLLRREAFRVWDAVTCAGRTGASAQLRGEPRAPLVNSTVPWRSLKLNGSSSTRWTASPPSVDWSRSTQRHGVASFAAREVPRPANAGPNGHCRGLDRVLGHDAVTARPFREDPGWSYTYVTFCASNQKASYLAE
jgi:hypothetical protein